MPDVTAQTALAAQQQRLVAVVVTHNRPEQLGPTLARLLASGPDVLQALVVVDNASGPATAALLDAIADPRLIRCHSAENLGGAGGFDLGLRTAVARFDPDWVVVMDDDARPQPGALEAFAAGDQTGRDAVAAAVFYPDGRICEMNRPSRNPFWHPRAFLRTLLGRGRDGYHIPPAAYDGPALPVDIASFVGMFLSRRTLRENGFPDPALFLYGDDVIYSLRLRRRGLRLVFDPALRFEHDCRTFADDRRRVFRPIWKVYYTYRNGLVMYRNAAGPLLFWPLLLLVVPKWLLAARRYGPERGLYLRLTARALRDGLRGGRGGLSHRELLALSGG